MKANTPIASSSRQMSCAGGDAGQRHVIPMTPPIDMTIPYALR
jgi:hypothetical protein